MAQMSGVDKYAQVLVKECIIRYGQKADRGCFGCGNNQGHDNRDTCPMKKNRDQEMLKRFYRELYIHKPHLKKRPEYKKWKDSNEMNLKKYMVSSIIYIQLYSGLNADANSDANFDVHADATADANADGNADTNEHANADTNADKADASADANAGENADTNADSFMKSIE